MLIWELLTKIKISGNLSYRPTVLYLGCVADRLLVNCIILTPAVLYFRAQFASVDEVHKEEIRREKRR